MSTDLQHHGTLLEALKRQTRRQHAALEDLNGLPESIPEYVSLLECFYGFVEPWERRLEAELDASDPVRFRRGKRAWLEADLAYYGASAATLRRLPRCLELPAVDSRAHILGAAYVLEGSTLGGLMISRHLASSLGVTPEHGGRYFAAYGHEVGAMWQAFRQELVAASTPENDAVMVTAAQNTFRILQAWFAAQKETP